jgi:mono/diheme cytochrome c family protein
VTSRSRIALFAGLAGLVLAAYGWDAGLFRPAPRLERTPAAVTRGRAVLRNRCLHCHAAIPLGPRVAGWTAERAYQAVGRLPSLYPSMPPFPGTDEERAALAVYLAALGAGEAPWP